MWSRTQENDVVSYFPEFVIVRNDNHGLAAVLQGGNPVSMSLYGQIHPACHPGHDDEEYWNCKEHHEACCEVCREGGECSYGSLAERKTGIDETFGEIAEIAGKHLDEAGDNADCNQRRAGKTVISVQQPVGNRNGRRQQKDFHDGQVGMIGIAVQKIEDAETDGTGDEAVFEAEKHRAQGNKREAEVNEGMSDR